MNLSIIPKKNGTYADAMVAIGVADLYTEIYLDNDLWVEPQIADQGDHYEIILPKEVYEKDLEGWIPKPGYEYVKFKDPDPLAPSIYFDYEAQKDREQKYREFLKATNENRRKKENINLVLEEHGGNAVLQPDPKLSLMKTLNSMRMGSNTFAQMYVAIANAPEKFKELVAAKLGIYSAEDALPEETEYTKLASTLQLFNPISGKGTNRAKPDGAGLSSLPVKLADWFEEWMKYRAFSKSMLTFMTGTDNKDTKILVIAPKKIGPVGLSNIHQSLLNERFYGNILIDIMVVLKLTETIIRNSEEFRGQTSILKFLARKPQDIISGFFQTYFKNLGTASAVMNVSFLGLPGWFPIKSKTDAENWLEIIDEHKRCLQSLKERYSDHVPVLMAYRTFLSTDDFMDASDFFVLYAIHYMKTKAANEWAEPFTVKNLGRLFMASETIQEIIKDKGFANLATAIRKSTVNQQIIKGKTGKAEYEIRYGLAQDWKRRMHDKNELVMLISEFAQKYNAENARHQEQGKASRRRLTEEDLTRVFALIEKTNNPKLVGSLLLAYGYAKASNDEISDNSN